ncbi:flavohemoprotein [Streptomyces asoensis]|uniref:nitric oxide dioxygenase n=1 Tax=Streptomyces asoensis TaxID=249586 RepID=A0A6M4WQ78_9ACTN|nr:globin domain-containing protein [Streptomyces asoensis]QJT02737.1 flavohemoprotein [Streptomyces asoensis]
MDAPTSRSADNGTSGGGDGWFTPRKQPEPAPRDEQGASEGRRLAALRPVGRNAVDSHGAAPQGGTTDAERRIHQDPPAPDAMTAPASAQPQSPPWQESPIEVHHPAEAPPSAQPRTPAPPEAPAPPTTPDASQGRAEPGAPVQQSPPMPQQQSQPQVPAEVPASPQRAVLAEPRSAVQQGTASPVDSLVPARSTPVTNESPDAVLIRRTMAEVAPVADKVTSYFYALLFVRHPDLRSLFPPAMDAQRDRLLKALLTAAEHMDDKAVLVEYLQNLGRGHRKYGTRAEHYPAVGECLIGALSKYAGAVWNAETEAAWVRTYTTISQVMIDAAAVDELRAPPWWYAEVVTHDLRTPDVAILTVRPNQPYPFLAGQYASLETPWWPRIWRHYSFASAPRSDGLLAFHVKAVPAGWVSSALVHRARPGDVIRLGPPAGSMTVDHTRNSGLLCLGGGTGIAPIKALVEDVAEHGTRRPVEVFYGARSDHDLYDIDTMLRLQQSHPWLEVRPVVDRHGLLQLPDAIRTFGPWAEYDAYVAGPPGMIRSGVDALRGVGIPAERIRHDSVEELVAAGS